MKRVRRTMRPKPGEALAMLAAYSPEPAKQLQLAGPLVIQFRFDGEPVAAMRPRVTMRGTFTPPEYARYKASLAFALRQEFGHLVSIPKPGTKERSAYLRQHHYSLIVDAYCRSDRSDWDNIGKAVSDALENAGIVANDKQIVDGRVRKHVDPDAPRVEIVLEELSA